MWEVRPRGDDREIFIDTPVPMHYPLIDPETDWKNLGAVLMDMDGSSTDTEKLVLEAMRQMMAEALDDEGFQFAAGDYANIIGDSTTNHLTWLLPHYGIALDELPKHMGRYYEKYHQSLNDIRDGKVDEKLIEPMPHLREFLLWAKDLGLKVALVTSSLQCEVDIIMPEVMKGMGMAPDYQSFYDDQIAADAVGESFLKPHPNLYVIVRERLGIPANRCVVIEDSTAGIAAGRLAGCSVCAVPHPHTRSHAFDLANVGVFENGLADVQAKMIELMG